MEAIPTTSILGCVPVEVLDWKRRESGGLRMDCVDSLYLLPSPSVPLCGGYETLSNTTEHYCLAQRFIHNTGNVVHLSVVSTIAIQM